MVTTIQKQFKIPDKKGERLWEVVTLNIDVKHLKPDTYGWVYKHMKKAYNDMRQFYRGLKIT